MSALDPMRSGWSLCVSAPGHFKPWLVSPATQSWACGINRAGDQNCTISASFLRHQTSLRCELACGGNLTVSLPLLYRKEGGVRGTFVKSGIPSRSVQLLVKFCSTRGIGSLKNSP